MSKPFKETVEERAKRDPEFKKALLRLAMAIVVVNEEITGTEKTQVEEIANYLDWSVTDI